MALVKKKGSTEKVAEKNGAKKTAPKTKDLVKIGGIWKNKSAAGKPYLSGSISEDVELTAGTRITIFPNGFKEEDKHPDYIIYKSEPMNGGAKAASTEESSDEIPF